MNSFWGMASPLPRSGVKNICARGAAGDAIKISDARTEKP
jgi:hypothetical protein